MTLIEIWDGTQAVCNLTLSRYHPSQSKEHTRMRWLAMAMARKKGFSFPDIGKFFDVHHTTVMYGIKEFEKLGDVRQFSELEKFLARGQYIPKGMRSVREKLPDDRTGVTLHFTIISRKEDGEGVEEIDGYLSTGEFPDGRLGEFFLKVGKQGDERAMWDSWCESSSIALQYGAPVEDLLGRFVNKRFEPSGAVTGVANIKRCSSPLDLVARYLLLKYTKTMVQNDQVA